MPLNHIQGEMNPVPASQPVFLRPIELLKRQVMFQAPILYHKTTFTVTDLQSNITRLVEYN
jgi:hypothetical protein